MYPELERELAEAAARVAVDPSTVLGNFELSEEDRTQLALPEHMQIIRESTTELTATGVAGWVDDDLAFVNPWGFAVDQITVPVLVRYGATDVLVPPAHGEWLAANVPGCVVKVDDTSGHMGSDPVQEITENLRWLRDGVPHREAGRRGWSVVRRVIQRLPVAVAEVDLGVASAVEVDGSDGRVFEPAL